MKKEIFNKLVEEIKAQPELYSTHKVTIKDGLEVHTFGHPKNTDLAQAKTLFKEKGYKGDTVYGEANALGSAGKLQNIYLTLLYGAEKDKISISIFEMGYAYAGRKSRYYPLRKNTPIFAWTKHMYDLQPVGRGKYIPNPRIQLGPIGLYGYFPQIGEIVTKVLLGIDYIPTARISYRHFAGTNNDFEAIGNMFGVRIPQALHKFNVNDVLMLYKTIQDFNQINKLCQFISKDSGFMQVDQPFSTNAEPWTHPMDLWQTIAKMLFKDATEYWVIRDYVGDNVSLKKRNVSLKVTSVKRWKDEHQKASIQRMLKGVPELKVKEVYQNALNGLEYPYELISTKDRLVQESVELHHCVGTYAHQINSGSCAIFSVTYEGKRWTLQVCKEEYPEGVVFKPIQFRGLCNESAPDKIGKRVGEILHANSCKISIDQLEKAIMGPMNVLDIL
jgi:hypothetical protein